MSAPLPRTLQALTPDLDPRNEVRVCGETVTDLDWYPDDEGELSYSLRLHWAESDDGTLPLEFGYSKCREPEMLARGCGWVERIFERLYWRDSEFRSWVQERTQRSANATR